MKIRQDSYDADYDLSHSTILRIVRLFFGPKIGILSLMRTRKRKIHVKGVGTFERELSEQTKWKNFKKEKQKRYEQHAKSQ